MTARTLAAAALVAVVGTALAQPPQPDVPAGLAPVPAALPPKVADTSDLPKLLATRVAVARFDGKFKDAVKLLADTYDLPLVIDPRLGPGDAMAACDGVADDKPVKLPKLANVRLDTVLKILAEQVNGKFLVYPDHIKIVPETFAAYESGVLSVSADPNDEPLLTTSDLLRSKPLIKRALVNASFKNKPLSEVIDEIAEATGANVAVSPLLPANVRQAPVTVRFANTPVDAAVRTLCEMTECGAIEDANVLLVTTRERATARAKEEAQKVKDRHPALQPVFGGGAGVGLPAQPDIATEVAKLKEQNEQLRKELEELKKAMKK